MTHKEKFCSYRDTLSTIRRPIQMPVDQLGAPASFPPGEGVYLKVRCPVKSCGQEVTLVCPYCQQGALWPDDTHFFLHCSRCHHYLRGVTCSCGFELSSSYIQQRQRRLQSYYENVDLSNYWAIAVALSLLGALLWIFS